MSSPVMEVSRSGMDVEYRRLEMVAQNIANAGSTRGPDGEPYVPMRLISGPRAVSAAQKSTAFGAPMAMLGAQVMGVEKMNVAARQVYEPSHPHADRQGFVSYPGVDQLSEVTTLMKALRTYEANVAVFNATRSMYLKAIELGGRS